MQENGSLLLLNNLFAIEKKIENGTTSSIQKKKQTFLLRGQFEAEYNLVELIEKRDRQDICIGLANIDNIYEKKITTMIKLVGRTSRKVEVA